MGGDMDHMKKEMEKIEETMAKAKTEAQKLRNQMDVTRVQEIPQKEQEQKSWIERAGSIQVQIDELMEKAREESAVAEKEKEEEKRTGNGTRKKRN